MRREDRSDLAVGHRRQASQNIPEVLIGFNSASPTAFDDGVEDRSSLAGLGFSEKEPVLFS
jgi:hypothetical protein